MIGELIVRENTGVCGISKSAAHQKVSMANPDATNASVQPVVRLTLAQKIIQGEYC